LSAVLIVAVVFYFVRDHKTPAVQETLADLNAQNLDAFKKRFNDGSKQVRIVLLLSPT
jgi:hypothetical protein